MKRVILFIAVVIAASLPMKVVADEGNEGAKISFVKSSYDFGNIKEADGSVSHVFEFENTGDEPLVIISATASCGCTRPDFPKTPINPGEKGEIKVTYIPTGYSGEFSKSIKVLYQKSTNTKAKVKRSVLKITGVVIPKK